MTLIDTGTYGAKVQSWRHANPRDVLRSLIEERPKADKKEILIAFRDYLLSESGEEYLDSVIEYWFANNYHSLIDRPVIDKTARQAKVEAIKKRIKAKIRNKAKLILLDMMLPNGKTLRNCTGKECAALGIKVGSWLTKIAQQVKPTEVVGAILSEAQVRKLYGR